MSISAIDTRETKLKWLLRPADWASSIALFGGPMAAAMLYGGVDHWTVMAVAIGANVVNSGLLLWGIVRVSNAARGRL